MNKPLTKEEREGINVALKRTMSQWGGGFAELTRAMQAEAFWREEVRRAEWQRGEGCPWCDKETAHDDECPYRLAQEPE